LDEEESLFIRDYLARLLASDIRHLTALASRHGILPLVYRTLKRVAREHSSLLSPLSSLELLLSGLQSAYRAIARRNMLMSAELIRLVELLEGHGIGVLAFKGPVLAQMAFGDITLRQYGDLDILIHPDDISRTIDLLNPEEYIPEIHLKEGTKETFFKCVNVIGLHKKSTGVRIEIHWELLSKNYAVIWKEKSLWSTRESIWINNKEIPILSVEQHLLYLCIHGAKHLFERLEWICDIDRIVRARADIDWQNLFDEAQKMGTRRMLYLGLALCQNFFGLKLPEMITEKIRHDKAVPGLISKIIEIHFSETSYEGRDYHSFGLLWGMRENFSDQLRFAGSGLFAPKFDDFIFLQLPEKLSFLYPLIRPYRLMTKYI
jgi:hypothetical protein